MVRSRLLSLLLTLVVGLGLASQAYAHRLPTGAEMQLQALQAMGLVQGTICGDLDSGKAPAPCPDDTCGLCAASAATEVPPAEALVRPTLRQDVLAVSLEDQAGPRSVLRLGPPAQGPPVSL